MKPNVSWGAVGPWAFRVMRWLGGSGLAMGLFACAGPAPGPVAGSPAPFEVLAGSLLRTRPDAVPWQVFRLPGKNFVPFEAVTYQGRPALEVRADRSVSILRQRFEPAVNAIGLRFSWAADRLPEGADLKDAGSTDAPVRILLAFDGDRTRWSARTHRLSELSQLLTGEPLPYATLSYVWSPADPVESVLNNARTDRIRKIVVESGTEHLGDWREYRRDVRADFVRAFGEEPGPLVGVALMTDTDNTGSRLKAWYGALQLDVLPSR